MYNLYHLDNDPEKAARYTADAHLDVLLNERVKLLGYIFARHADKPEEVLVSAMVAYSEDKAFYAVYRKADKKPHHIEIARLDDGQAKEWETNAHWAGIDYANLAWVINNTRALAVERAFRYGREHRLHSLYIDWFARSQVSDWYKHTDFRLELANYDELFIEIQSLVAQEACLDTKKWNQSMVLMHRIYYAYNIVRYGGYKRTNNVPEWMIKLGPSIAKLRKELLSNQSLPNSAKIFYTELIKEFPHPLTDLTQ